MCLVYDRTKPGNEQRDPSHRACGLYRSERKLSGMCAYSGADLELQEGAQRGKKNTILGCGGL